MGNNDMSTKCDDGLSKTCAFEWKIENISQFCMSETNAEIKSPSFCPNVVGLQNTKWSLLLNLNHVSFGLQREDSNEPSRIEVKYTLSFLGKDGKTLTFNYIEHCFESAFTLGCTEYVSRDKVFIEEREKFLPEDALTVQCWLSKEKSDVLKMQHLYARTVFKIKRRSVLWKIENFGIVKPVLRNKLKDNLIDLDLVLKEGTKLYTDLISFNDSIKYISFNASVIDSLGRKENPKISKHFEIKTGILSSMDILCIWTDYDQRLYLPNDVLSLHFECVYSTETQLNDTFECGIISSKLMKEFIRNEKTPYVGKDKINNSGILKQDLKSMYTEGNFSDVELRTSKKTFPVHKNILSARSPVFRELFSNNMKKSKIKHVDITDLDEETVHQMLLYMYTGTIKDLHFESACKLYAAADKFENLFLKYECSSFLKDNICPTKACKILILADQYQDDNLKNVALAYILKHNEVFDLIEWKNLIESNIKLASDVMLKKIKTWCKCKSWCLSEFATLVHSKLDTGRTDPTLQTSD